MVAKLKFLKGTLTGQPDFLCLRIFWIQWLSTGMAICRACTVLEVWSSIRRLDTAGSGVAHLGELLSRPGAQNCGCEPWSNLKTNSP